MWFNNICLCPQARLPSIYYNQLGKYKYNEDNTKLFHNNSTINNMTLTKSPYSDVVEHTMKYQNRL